MTAGMYFAYSALRNLKRAKYLAGSLEAGMDVRKRTKK